MGRFLELRRALAEILRQRVERRRVNLDAGALHGDDDRHQRPLDGLVQRGHMVGREPGFQRPVQAIGDIGVLGGVVQRGVERNLGEGDAVLAAAGDVGEFDRLVGEMATCQIVEIVFVASGVEHIGQQHGVVERSRRQRRLFRQMLLDGAGQHQQIVLGVVGDLEDRRVLEKRLQWRQRRSQRDLLELAIAFVAAAALQVELGWRAVDMADRHVAAVARRGAERKADQLGLHGVERGGLGIDGDDAGGVGGTHPGGQRYFILHQLVGALAGRRSGVGEVAFVEQALGDEAALDARGQGAELHLL